MWNGARWHDEQQGDSRESERLVRREYRARTRQTGLEMAQRWQLAPERVRWDKARQAATAQEATSKYDQPSAGARIQQEKAVK
ncbi:hypothetical protein BM221_004579 [Beauveria bassiana]|uniref:Uncharacterized protein n=1 Tax=Beauveria bassiana TaxID=176275 RepID=A0A2N6NRN0_BEABA|nr:hypothetical protein BM221_004579 [Beauveria bassiana]